MHVQQLSVCPGELSSLPHTEELTGQASVFGGVWPALLLMRGRGGCTPVTSFWRNTCSLRGALVLQTASRKKVQLRPEVQSTQTSGSGILPPCPPPSNQLLLRPVTLLNWGLQPFGSLEKCQSRSGKTGTWGHCQCWSLGPLRSHWKLQPSF